MTQAVTPQFPILEELLATVALETGLSLDQLKSPSRRARYVRARSLFAARAREHGYNLVDIGTALNRSHCAVMNYLKPNADPEQIPGAASVAASDFLDTKKYEVKGVTSMTERRKITDKDFENLSPEERRDLVAALSKTATSKEEKAALALLFREQDGGADSPRVEKEPAPAKAPAKEPHWLEGL